MSRVRISALAGAVCALAAALGTASAGATTPPRDQLRSLVCQKALDPPMRAVSIEAVMRPVAGTERMEMRFELMRQSAPGGPFTVVRGRLLGSWISPQNPTLGQRPDDVWILTHPVVDLAAPATYRFRVVFRWIGAQGQRLATAVQTSADCYQPELRADLLVRSLTVAPLATTSADDTYTAVIANRGQTGAGPFEFVLVGAGSAPQSETVAWVGPRSSVREQFAAPACTAGGSVTATVDPDHTIDEYDFANNALSITCPAPASPPS
ncbi:MAG TPA: CARDB domain-containing protein [Solirubrobacteraceae bacterium]|nr:CARDB domain-containing protein [Solirubrobacteraceae bacterium]